MLANVVFTIELGKRAKVGDVKIQAAEGSEIDQSETDRLVGATRSLR